MPDKCVICAKSGKKGDGRSYFRFPQKLEKKLKWLKSLQLPENVEIPKWHCICSDHFSPFHLSLKPSGIKILKSTAIPVLHEIFREVGLCSANVPSSSTFTATTIESSEINSGVDILGTKQLLEERFEKNDSSSTLTASAGSFDTVSAFETSSVSEAAPYKPPKKRRKYYVGDITSDDFSSPTKAKRSFQIAKLKIVAQKPKLEAMRKQQSRLRAKITSLTALLSFLKQKNYLSEGAQEYIQAALPRPAAEIVNRILRGSRREQYSPALRTFALTLHFYSPRAYSYVRKKFNNSLPHASTITKWYQKVENYEQDNKFVYCNLVMDEMSIRKKTEWVEEKFYGYIDIGANVFSDTVPEVQEAPVFLVTSINGHWKIPVGYFFIDGLCGSERANLVRNCLQLLHNVGIIITSLTFDRAASNISMANQLGANLLDPRNLKPHFPHPITQDKVFIFLDICHMVKLVRNCLGDKKVLTTKEKKNVNWIFLENLVNLQEVEGLHAATKVRKRHIQYSKEKMRVKIATQTFSKCVCDVLQYLEKDLKLEHFQGAHETAS